jgi:hypothetical protein
LELGQRRMNFLRQRANIFRFVADGDNHGDIDGLGHLKLLTTASKAH